MRFTEARRYVVSERLRLSKGGRFEQPVGNREPADQVGDRDVKSAASILNLGCFAIAPLTAAWTEAVNLANEIDVACANEILLSRKTAPVSIHAFSTAVAEEIITLATESIA